LTLKKKGGLIRLPIQGIMAARGKEVWAEELFIVLISLAMVYFNV